MPPSKAPSRFNGLLEYRCIGPFRGGRVVAVAGDPTNPAIFYFGGIFFIGNQHAQIISGYIFRQPDFYIQGAYSNQFV